MKYYCIINCQYPQITDKIKSYGYTIIPVEKSDDVSLQVSMHADMLYLKYYDTTIYVSHCQQNNIDKLTKAGLVVNTVKLYPGYETECKLNMVITDKFILCNPKTALPNDIFENKKNLISTKQGYTKCSTIVINEDLFITDDVSVYSALTDAGCRCLGVEKGSIALEGYNYGFIGGASAYIPEKNIVLFFGDITKHSDYLKIVEFCNEYDIKIDYIKDMPLTDIGGAIFI